MFLSRNTGSKRMSQKSKGSGDMQYFKEVLNKVGISLQFSDNPNIYTKESLFLTRDIQRALEEHGNYPNNLPEFINGLKKLCSGAKYFKNALNPSIIDDAKSNNGPRQQECLFRVLLEIDCIQSDVVKFLLDEAVPYIVEQESENMLWVRRILGTLRYLSYIQNPSRLNEQLLSLLEAATEPAQLEMLTYIPDIIPDSEYEDTARKLAAILDECPKVTAAIIDCLSCLGLTSEMKIEIQDRVLNIMNTSTSLDNFPMILNFLGSDCNAANLHGILLRTRSAIDAIMAMAEGSKDDRDTNQVLTFQQMRKLTCSFRGQVADGWLKVVSTIKTPEDHCPIDILILLMLHSVDRDRKRAVEALIRKKIKLRQLKTDLMEKTLEKYLAPQMYNDYLSSVISIASNLLYAFGDGMYAEMARVLYKGAFKHKHGDAPSRQQVLASLVIWPGGQATVALGVLITLGAGEDGPNLLRPHALLLMGLLDKLDMVGLAEAGQIFELLCALLWAPTEGGNMPDTLQNDMLMIVRKQLTSSKKSVRYRGVIAAVATVKHMAKSCDPEDSILSDVSYSSVSDLPPGPARKAADLLELAVQSIQICAQAQGLFYDQLAHMVVSSDSLDQHFMAWLVDTITGEFQNNYVVNSAPGPKNDISFTTQYILNASDAVNDTIIINIGELTTGDTGMMVSLAPLFRLVRLLHQRHHQGSLGTIDAVLGCGIAMPDVDPDVGLDSCGTEDSKKIMDCTFHCINWFREIVNAFVTQKGQSIRQKLLTRITNLLDLEETMKSYVKSLPEHRLPVSHFYNVNMNASRAQNEPPPPKRRKVNANTSRVSTQGKASQTQAPKRRKPAKEKEMPALSYREMDTDIILLLKHPLAFEENASAFEETLTLNLVQFRFIMKDLVLKLQTLSKTPSGSNLSHLSQTVKPEDLVNDCVRLMPFIDGHLTHIVEGLKSVLDRCDGIHDAHEMFQPPAKELKLSLALILQVISLIFSWTGFQSPSKFPLVRDCLRALINADSKTGQLKSAQQLIMVFINRLTEISEYCLTLQGAVALVNIARALSVIAIDQNAPKKKMIHLSGKLLERKWFTVDGLPEGGAISSVNIDILVRAHLEGCDTGSVSSIVSWVHGETAQLKSKDDHLSTFQCINKTNFAIFYRGICSSLLDALKTELSDGKTNTEHLDIWCNVATTLHALMDIVKVQETRTNLNSFMKKSTGILKLFVSHALPIFEITLKSKPDRVLEILKIMQQTTRFIHNLCCHSKVAKDSGLVAHVPLMRQTLETLVYRVKALLAANNCSAFFWMGTLKNKDLAGNEISSQSTAQESEALPEEEELPPDESEHSDNENNDSNNSDMNDSASEIY